MRQSFFIIIFIAIVLVALVLLNAASYVRLERNVDFEVDPDRSTYNAGGTGNRAIYDYLQETGYKVTRWQQPTELLTREGVEKPDTFVVIGRTKRRFEKTEISALLAWVGSGGRLVLIDRFPHPDLLPSNGNWKVNVYPAGVPEDIKTDDQAEMTQGVQPVKPDQPTIFTSNVDTVLPSRFIGNVMVNWNAPESIETTQDKIPPARDYEAKEDAEYEDDTPPPPKPKSPPTIVSAEPPPTASVDVYGADVQPVAPVVHISVQGRPLLIDYPYGTGRIVMLSDPYIISNAGVALADNQQLALNVVARRSGGLIAFDEYHQGHGASQNRIISYFSGTPVLAIVLQIVLITLTVVWSSGKRFARPLPLGGADRRSKLEYVASMAELQQSAKSYDLAIENIYMRLRRVLARYAGVEANSRTDAIATRVAARGKIDPHAVETLMRQCEATINGEKINGTQALSLIARLRDLENRLGLRMRSREVRQLKEK